MAAIRTSRCELPEAVTNHVFGDEYRYMAASIMDTEVQPDHFGHYHGATGPGTNNSGFTGFSNPVNLFEQFGVDVRSLFY